MRFLWYYAVILSISSNSKSLFSKRDYKLKSVILQTEIILKSIADIAMQRRDIITGLRIGIPIALGYFAVAFSLGIIAKQAGLTAAIGFGLRCWHCGRRHITHKYRRRT